MTATAGARADVWFSAGAGSGWRLLFLLGPAFVVSPGLIQKAYGARDERAVRRGIAWNGIGLMIFACAPAAIGLAARTVYPSLDGQIWRCRRSRDRASAVDRRHRARRGVLGRGELGRCRAVHAGDLGVARSLPRLHSSARRPTRSVLRVARDRGDGWRRLWRWCRHGVWQSVRAAVSVFYAILTVTLFVPVLGGLYVPGAGRREGLTSILVGVPVLA